jgi:hypothetical protein
MQTNLRKALLAGAGVVATVLVIASTAYACTVFKGRLTLTGNGNQPTGSSVTLGKNAGMQHCANSPSGYTSAPLSGGTVDVVVAKNTTGTTACPNSQLPADTYDINYENGAAFSGDLPTSYRNWLIDCMSPHSNNLTTMTVDSNGDGSKTGVSLNSTERNTKVGSQIVDESAICVSTSDGAYGNQGPIFIY